MALDIWGYSAAPLNSDIRILVLVSTVSYESMLLYYNDAIEGSIKNVI
tara:strand:+ start:765 stop:908 length:144 start_codon:yes stop_codon:yes gene_type:complete